VTRTRTSAAHLFFAAVFAFAAGARAEPKAAPPPVVLLAPGRPPLAPLRLELSKTGVEKGEMTAATSMTMETADGPNKIELPKMASSLTATNAAAAGAGAVTVNVKFGGLKLTGPNAAELEAKLHDAGMSLEGLGCSYVITDRGLATSSSVTVPPNAPPVLRQFAEQTKSTLDVALLPLPAEPVGVGARWKQEGRTQSGGVAMTLISTYELLERSKTFIRVKRSVVARGEPGSIPVPGSAAKVEILKCDGAGEGEMRQPLDQVMPSSWTFDLKFRMSLKAQGQAIQQTVSVNAGGGDQLVKK